jgi:uncharacterized protein affecting Mg2+/Co2+ transport
VDGAAGGARISISCTRLSRIGSKSPSSRAFEPDRSDPDEPRYFWRYAIEIANLGDKPVTLMERHWRITDAEGRQQEVRGPGVVGEQPTIERRGRRSVTRPAAR